MKQSHLHKLLLLTLLYLFCGKTFAQNNFAYQAQLDTVTESGFYNITLSPGVLAKCKNEADDIRIKDDGNNDAPYILYTETARPNEETFTEFPLSYSENRTAVIINNILPNSLDKLFLLIKNSEAQRLAILSGSNDAVHWFVIKENIILQNEYDAGNDAFVQSVSFPPSSYKYFRISMPGKNILPLNIVKAGVYRSSFSGIVYDALPPAAVVQKDSSDKRSYVYISFDDNYVIDKLSLRLSGAKYYRRKTIVYEKNTINSPLSEDTLSSAKPAGIEFHVKTNRLLVVIDNKDNTPLTVESAAAFQLHTSLTAYLDAGKSYALYFGDSTASAPSYDLQYFNDSIGSNIHSLAVKAITKANALAPANAKKNDAGKWLLWGVIIAVLLLLLYFSFRMIKDISHKTKNDAHL